jgi:AcrR family transcriptional regulator
MRNGGADTRQRILSIAGALFADKGYAATSLADIAERLGTSKAALYYHFRSKAAILDALLAEPLAAYTRLAEAAADGSLAPTDLLTAVIDTTVAARSLLDLLGNDPSTRAQLDSTSTRARSTQINDTIVTALIGPNPTPESTIRAQAAYTIAKHGTLTVLAAHDGRLDNTARTELLAAALRALDS